MTKFVNYMDIDEPTKPSAVYFDPMDIDEPTEAAAIAFDPVDNGLMEMDTQCEIRPGNSSFDCGPFSINCQDTKGCLPSKLRTLVFPYMVCGPREAGASPDGAEHC